MRGVVGRDEDTNCPIDHISFRKLDPTHIMKLFAGLRTIRFCNIYVNTQ